MVGGGEGREQQRRAFHCDDLIGCRRHTTHNRGISLANGLLRMYVCTPADHTTPTVTKAVSCW
jgi:hypothetical protein